MNCTGIAEEERKAQEELERKLAEEEAERQRIAEEKRRAEEEKRRQEELKRLKEEEVCKLLLRRAKLLSLKLTYDHPCAA